MSRPNCLARESRLSQMTSVAATTLLLATLSFPVAAQKAPAASLPAPVAKGAPLSGVTADLFQMIDLDRASEVRATLLRGAKVDATDDRGDHALLVAARSGSLPVVQVLVDAGAKVNLRNKWGDTALMVAALNGQEGIVRYLRAKGADINNAGWSALHYASVNGHANVVRYLLDQGGNPVAASPNGVTPLMMAARENKTEVMKVLLEYGADPAQKNDKGETAYDWAVREEHTTAIDLLKKLR